MSQRKNRLLALIEGLVLIVVFTAFDNSLGGKMETKHPLRWAWGALISLFILGWANSCALAQNVPIFYGALAPHIQGQTVCDKVGNLAIILNSQLDQSDTAHTAVIIRHEMVHVKQITAIGNCEDAGTEYKKNPLLKEIPAYCEELHRRQIEGDAAEVLDQFVSYMTMYYGLPLKLDYQAVLKLTNELCP